MTNSLSMTSSQEASTFKFDFHTHSNASDGDLSPTALMQRAKAFDIDCIALTDHDTTAGLTEAAQAANSLDIKFITGIEISVTWEKRCFHIVGLDIDPTHPPLIQGLTKIADLRLARAEAMAQRLSKQGLPDTFRGAAELAGQGMLTRTHFAKYMVDQGMVKDMNQAFDKYLKQGKPGYVQIEWASLEEALTWINNSGGIAVLAHPMRYKLTASWLKRFLTAFKNHGGRGIEIVTGNGTPETIKLSASYARSFELLGSAGSDFHTPEAQWINFGKLPGLPADITPVWEKWLS